MRTYTLSINMSPGFAIKKSGAKSGLVPETIMGYRLSDG
jgi:hypothetical protein